MRKLLSFVGFFAVVSVFGFAADGAPVPTSRGAAHVSRVAGGVAPTLARMPSMPGIGIGIGGNPGSSNNLTHDVPTGNQPGACPPGGCDVGGGGNNTGCTPGATRACTTSAGAAGMQTCQSNRTWGACVANSAAAYTINDCMNALLACVNGGALPGGLADMYNDDQRNAIVNGMGLCKTIVDKCIAEIPIYHGASDVWIDFNSRVVQPQYYSFILRKTGLTPNQAETTCALIDKNVYGKSFAAVNDANKVQGEFGQQIGAYNMNTDAKSIPDNPYTNTLFTSANPLLMKTDPLGAGVGGNKDYDSKRGHYARWDASAGECLIRVAAYNKDELITNRWLGLGDDKAAEVWRPAGSNFSCNKDLFEFGLMNQTKSAALLGTTIGTAVGAGTGALIGNVRQKKAEELVKEFCGADAKHPNKENLEKLNRELGDNTKRAILNEYLGGPPAPGSQGNEKAQDLSSPTQNPFYQQLVLRPGAPIEYVQCQEIVALHAMYFQWRQTDTQCTGGRSTLNISNFCFGTGNNQSDCDELVKEAIDGYAKLYSDSGRNSDYFCQLLNDTFNIMKVKAGYTRDASFQLTVEPWSIKEGHKAALGMFEDFIKKENCEGEDANEWENKSRADRCPMFKNPNVMYKSFNADIYCMSDEKNCINAETFQHQVMRLASIMEPLGIGGEVAERTGMSGGAKGALIGGAVGLGAGGLATAITAFVEKNNIHCQVGDGLETVSFNKNGNIESLKNYYVKWALNLPDVTAPVATAPIVDCQTWNDACATLTSISQCISAAISYKPSSGANVLVHNACAISESTCSANRPVAISQGACSSSESVSPE